MTMISDDIISFASDVWLIYDFASLHYIQICITLILFVCFKKRLEFFFFVIVLLDPFHVFDSCLMACCCIDSKSSAIEMAVQATC